VRRLVVHIDSLRLRGLSREEGHRIVARLREELAASAFPAQAPLAARIDRLHGGKFRCAPNGTASGVSTRIARVIRQRLSE
jgi:hypothetical protein